MSRKHFEAVANTIAIRLAATESPEGRSALRGIVQDLARDFARFNPNFDAHRFIAACGF